MPITPRRKQSILVGAANYRRACEIAKRAGFSRNEFTYVYERRHFDGQRDAILLLDGTGDYSFWNDMDPYRLELNRMEAAGNFTTVLISTPTN